MSALVPRLLGTLCLILGLSAAAGGCRQPSSSATGPIPDSVLVDSVRTIPDRFDGPGPPVPPDSATVRRWTQRLLTVADSLASPAPDSARTLFREGLRAATALGDSTGMARCLRGLGRTHGLQGDYERALSYYRRALPIARRRGLELETAEALSGAGDMLQRTGRYEEATSRYREALAIYREHEVRTETSHMLSDIGIIYAQTGRFEQALQQWREALATQRAIDDREGMARTLGNLGILHKNRGQYEKALTYYREVLSIQRELGIRRDAARTLGNMGVLHQKRDRYRKALSRHREALSLYRTLEKREGVAATLNNIGIVYRAQGRYEEALRHYRKSLSIKRELGDRNGVANTLHNMGIVYKHSGRYENALNHFRTVRSVRRELGDREGTSVVLNNIGAIHELQGRAEKALALHRRALSVKRELGDRDGIAATLHHIGDAHRQLGRLEAAHQHYRRAFRLNRRMGRSSKAVQNLEACGRIYLSENRWEAATDTLRRAVRLSETLRRNATSPESRRSLLSTQIEAYRALATAYVRSGRPDSTLRALEQARARLLADQLAGTARGDTSLSVPSAAALRRTLGWDEAALLYANTGSELPLTVVTMTRDTTYARTLPDSAFRERLARKYGGALDRLRRRNGPLTEALGTGPRSTTEVRPGLAEAIRLYRHQLTQLEGADAIQTDLARQLHDLLLGPLQEQIGDVEQLTVVPSGALSYLPMDALRDADGTYLIERKHVRYAQSLTVLRQLQARTYREPDRPLLALGGADYGSTSPPRGTPLLASARGAVETKQHASTLLHAAERRMERGRSPRAAYTRLGYDQWAGLYGTKLEVRKLGRIFGEEATVLTDAAASEQRVRQLSASGGLARYRRVHFATHGIALPEAPQLSALVLAQAGTSDSLASRDGYLTMPEIADLNLRADVAVLSACQTGFGRVVAGEGVVNLSHAFLRAGANATLVSRWRVLDWSTHQFMASVYRETKNGGSFAEAVTQVKRAFIDGRFGARNTDPIRWAPFVYYGRE